MRDVVAFDTGPGNMLIDALAKEFSRGKLTCDRGGRIAARTTFWAAGVTLDVVEADMREFTVPGDQNLSRPG